MATTTQVTSYRSAGQPDDGTGAVGDVCLDTLNRGYWVKQSNNSWAGSFQSAAGPVGPAQLSYNGTPPSSFGQNGNGCCDLTGGLTYLKSNNAWSQIGSIVGPSGQAQPALNNFASTFAPTAQANNLSVSANTYTQMQSVGQSAAYVFTPLQNCYVTNVQITNYNATGATAYFYLGDANKNVILNYNSGNGQASNSVGSIGYTATQYPLSANTNYYWYTTRSAAGSVYANVQMTVTTPSTGTGIGFLPPASCYNNQAMTLSSSAQALGQAGLPGQTWYYKYSYASYFYGAQMQLSGSGSVQLTFGGLYTSSSISLSSTPATTNVGPFPISQTYLAANSQNSWGVMGSGTLSTACVVTQIGL